MCTLVFGLGVCGPGTVLLAANRDEDPARASEPPQVLRREPRVVGGRDAVAGGTWLALRADAGTSANPVAPGVALLLNRFDPEPGRPGRRSRGLLTLDVAAAAEPRATALAEAASGRYAPCSLLWLSGGEAWLLALRAGEAPTLEDIRPGWHAITHFEMDDPADARVAWLLGRIGARPPAGRAEGEALLRALIASHGETGAPPVCLHGGRAPTVSASLLWLGNGQRSYLHAQGPSCVTAFADVTALTG